MTTIPKEHARVMLPLALRKLFGTGAQPKITVTLLSSPPHELKVGFEKIGEGDICENFERLITDLELFFKVAEKSAQSGKSSYALEVALEREDGQEWALYHQLVLDSSINALFAWADDRFSRSEKESQPPEAQLEPTEPPAESSAESEAVSGNNVFLRTLAKMAADAQTPRQVSSKLLSIINWISEEHHAKSTGKLIAELIEDPSLPKAFRDAISDAAEEIMNDLNRGNEMTLAWMKVFYDQAIREGR
jgi:hypothetical protein